MEAPMVERLEDTTMTNEARIAAERTKARKLVRAALALGYFVSVNDGEEYTVKRCNHFGTIVEALMTTDADTLVFRTADGERIGFVFIVYGNGAEDLINDYTANGTMEALINSVEA